MTLYLFVTERYSTVRVTPVGVAFPVNLTIVILILYVPFWRLCILNFRADPGHYLFVGEKGVEKVEETTCFVLPITQ
jgi:hypothetical protein